MPYITQDRRIELATGDPMATAGELNFMVTSAVTDYLATHGLSYKTINDIVGALEGAKAEFQRRVVGPYEDEKIAANGDVYPA